MSKKNEAGDVDAQTEKKTKKELILELKNKLHKRLILPEVKSRFDFLYNTFCKCLVCDDTLFDPILCTDCDIISCRSCVTDLDEGSNLYPAFISCKHVNLAEIPDINKRHLEKIKVSCYYNCKTQNLDLFNYSDHIRKCRIRQENKTKHHHYGLQTDNPNKVAKDQEGYSSKILLDKIDKLEITFELTNQKLINENEANKQLAQTFKTALIDERISSNIATKQMFNLFAAYKPIDENEIDILENIETLIEEDQEEEIALEKSLGKNKHEDVLHKIEISGVNLKDNENLCRNVKIEKAVVERRFTIDEIRNLTDEFMNKNIMEFLNKYNIPKIEIKKEVFGKFEEKDELSNILYLKESNTDIEILNNAKFKLVSKRELFIYLILFSIQINAPKVRNLTGVYFSADLEINDKDTNAKIGLAFTHYDNLNLLDYILDKETKKITDKEICKYLIKLVEVIIRIHDLDESFISLRPENIIITPGKDIILINRHHKILSEASSTLKGRNYGSPESTIYRENSKSDIWSIGAIMIHFFSGRIPWKNISESTIKLELFNNPTDIYKNFDKNHLAYPIIQNCCRKGEDDRPSSKELLAELKIIYEKL